MTLTDPEKPLVKVTYHPRMMSVVLNRPQVLNCLTIEMIRLIQEAMKKAIAEDHIQFVLMYGAGNRGFSSGGDLKFFAEAMQEHALFRVNQFLQEEYALDLSIHRFPKPVIVLADGVTMGGGLGIAAGADIVLATERTRMAMPETSIGFFPDVGATGWLFLKSPGGYPEYLTLTGYEMEGSECVRLGFANHLVKSERLKEIVNLLEGYSGELLNEKGEAVKQLDLFLSPFFEHNINPKPEMDEWVAAYFAGKTSVIEIMESLSQCRAYKKLCDDVFRRISERSPTSLALTLKLLRHNQGRPLEEVFAFDLKAARFMMNHPDCYEGVRARILEKDNHPRWQPGSIEEVQLFEL